MFPIANKYRPINNFNTAINYFIMACVYFLNNNFGLNKYKVVYLVAK